MGNKGIRAAVKLVTVLFDDTITTLKRFPHCVLDSACCLPYFGKRTRQCELVVLELGLVVSVGRGMKI